MLKLYFLIGIWSIGIFLIPHRTFAILPPDLVVSLGSQIIQVVAIAGFLSAALLSTFVLFYRQCIQFVVRYKFSLSIIMVSVIMTLGAHYAMYTINAQSQFIAQQSQNFEENINVIKQNLENSFSRNELKNYVSYCEQNNSLINNNEKNSCLPGHFFVSDTITVFAQTPHGPLVFEFDANRLEKVAGVYTQYFFLNAIIKGVDYSYYQQTLATTSIITASGFVKEYKKIVAEDQSTRAVYSLVLEIGGKDYTIEINEVMGDFITRNTPDYTRIQSSASAKVTVEGISYPANALVEMTYSDDYTKKIFYPGRDKIKVKTHQFVLWDSLNNFYLFDDSKTNASITEYVSHTWLLYKNADSNFLKKSFTGTYEQTGTQIGSREWMVNFPEFNSAEVALTELSTFKNTADRDRFLVSGTVSDTSGTRNITGVVHVIE